MDLYETLGVNKESTPSEIKKAYYAKSKQTHSDLTGNDKDNQEFVNISFAYSILSDPEKKKHYDETGNAEEVIDYVDSICQKYIAIVIEGILDNNPDDVITYIRSIMGKHITKSKLTISELETTTENLLKFRKKIVSSPKNDLINETINQRIESCKNAIITINKNIEGINRALEYFEEYTFMEQEEDMEGMFENFMNNLHINNWSTT